LVADAIGLRENAASYQGSFQALSPGLLVRSVLFIGEQWNTHRYPGSNGPYWSLGFEVWYYVTFGAFLFAPRQWGWLLAAAALAFIGPKVALIFPAWLFGMAVYHYCAAHGMPHCAARRLSPATGWILLAVPLAVLAVYQMAPYPQPYLQAFQNITFDPDRFLSLGQDYLVAALFSAHLIGFVTLSATFAPWLERHARIIRWISGATFSIYLAHLPIMHLLVAISPSSKSSPWTLALLLTVTPILCLGFAEISERRKDAWRRLIASAPRVLELLSPGRSSPGEQR
jgi:peptidoglycan/LPS O-acetylase OafA/YrhL